MDLRKLRHAVILAEEGNYARASRRLNLTQPALTRSIQSLEGALKLQLFDRLAGRIQPTVDGLRILDHARAMLRLEASLRGEASMLARGESGRVAFGVGPMLAPLIGAVLAHGLQGTPRLEVRVEIRPVQVLSELLLDDRLDFYVADTSHGRTSQELAVQFLHAIHAGYFVRPGHPLAARDDIMLRDLADYPLGSPSLWELDGWAAPSALAQIACDDSAALKELALTTDTVLLGMRLAMEPELAQNRLVALPTRLLSGPSRVGVVERRGRSRSASASRLIGEFDKALAPFAVEPEPGDGPAGSP